MTLAAHADQAASLSAAITRVSDETRAIGAKAMSGIERTRRQRKHAEAAAGTAAPVRDDRDFQERVFSEAQALVERSMPGLLAKKGVWPEETYRKILACLHAD